MDPWKKHVLLTALCVCTIATISNGAIIRQRDSSCRSDPMMKSSMTCSTPIYLASDNYVVRRLTIHVNRSPTSLPSTTLKRFKALKQLSMHCPDEHEKSCGVPHLKAGFLEPVSNTLEKFSASSSKILSLPNNFFCGAFNLSSIDLSSNEIEDVSSIGLGSTCPPHASWNSARFINMDSNSIQVLPRGVFSQLVNLDTLILSNNLLSRIEDWAFQGLVRIRAISLSNNRLNTLPENVFQGLASLAVVNLDSNSLITFPSFVDTSSLTVLTLSNNDLERIPPEKLAGLSLENLDLSANRLNQVPKPYPPFPIMGFLGHHSEEQIAIGQQIEEPIDGGHQVDEQTDGGHQIDESIASGHQVEPIASGHQVVEPIASGYQVEEPLGGHLSGVKMSDSTPCLTKIKRLRLQQNHGCLPNLTFVIYTEELYLSINAIRNLSKLSSLVPHSLKIIYLDKNLLTKIDKNDFAAFRKLEDLTLSFNDIQSIAPGAFDNNSDLLRVALDNNKLTTLDGVFDGTLVQSMSAAHNVIQHFHASRAMTELDLGFNSLTEIKFHENGQTLMQLDLSFTSIEELGMRRLIKLSSGLSWSHVWLGGSDVWSLGSIRQVKRHKLRELSMFINRLTSLCQGNDCRFWRNQTTGSIRVQLSSNQLQCSYEIASDASNPHCHANNSLETGTVIDMKFIEALQYKPNTGHCRSSVYDIAVRCKSKCPDKCNCHFSANRRHVVVDCSGEALKSVPAGAMDINVRLYLDGNNISYVDKSDITMPAERLYLNSSQLRDFHQDAFAHLHQLTILHLGSNQLTRIPPHAFDGLSNLQELYLSHNRLLDLVALDLGSLAVLELHDNLMTSYDVWDIRNAGKFKLITLDDNPWSCACDHATSLRAFLLQHDNVLNAANVKCGNGSAKRSLTDNNFSECPSPTAIPRPPESSRLAATIWGGAFGAMTLLVLCIILTRIYRHNIRVVLHSWGCRLSSRKPNPTFERFKKFDVFVSHSIHDDDFLQTNILPILQDIDDPYRVYLPNSDAQADVRANAQAEDRYSLAVHHSRATLILLSENFVQDPNCVWAFKLAYHQMIDDQRHKVIAVVVDKVPEKLDVVMKYFLRSNRCLTWGEFLFRKKLYYAMPDRLKVIDQEEGSQPPLSILHTKNRIPKVFKNKIISY